MPDINDDAMLELLGKQPTSNTMPVQQAPQALPQATNPWEKGQIVGGGREGQADFARLGGGFGDANTDSMKHTFGRIAQNFEHTPQGLQALLADAEFKQFFPQATANKDWIDFGGQLDPHTGTKVGKIDVMHAFDPTMGAGNNKNWQWLTEEEALGGGGGQAAQQAQQIGGPALAPQPEGEDTMAKILAEIQALQGGGASPMDQSALLELL